MGIGAYRLGDIGRSQGDGGKPPRVIKDGCEFSTACTECPLPRCKYDESPGHRPGRQNVRELVERGLLSEEIAAALGVSQETVRGYLKEEGVTAQSLKICRRRARVKALFLEGRSDEEICRALGVSRVTLFSDRSAMHCLRKRDRRSPSAMIIPHGP